MRQVRGGARVGVFGAFRFDLSTGELRKNGIRLRLEEKPALVLQHLVEKAGTVVTREELQQLLWPIGVHIDFNHGLNKSINRIRAVLGDDREQPRYIETLSRRGYRFIAPVEMILPENGKEHTRVPSLVRNHEDRRENSNEAGSLVIPLPNAEPSRWSSLAPLGLSWMIVVALLLGTGLVLVRTRVRAASSAGKAIVSGPKQQQPFTIRTLAGNGVGGFSSDGVLATDASLQLPVRVAVDGHGNLYISDYGNSRIREVDRANGYITTVAGDGRDAFGGDGGPATSASLNHPGGVTFDSKGNLYIADSDNHRIRKVDSSTHRISTVAGIGTPGFGGDGDLAIQASLYYPAGVAVDRDDNVYIADLFNNRIRKIDKNTGRISTVAGDGTTAPDRDGVPAVHTAINFPHGLSVDAKGTLYIAEEDNHRIRRVDADTGIITTVAGTGQGGYGGDGGAAVGALLYNPRDVAVDQAGSIYIADHRNSRIRRIEAATGIITTIAGNGAAWFNGDGRPATSASLYLPVGVAVDQNGDLYIADTYNARIRIVQANSMPGRSW